VISGLLVVALSSLSGWDMVLYLTCIGHVDYMRVFSIRLNIAGITAIASTPIPEYTNTLESTVGRKILESSIPPA
jgi:hypothetical protein